MNNTFDFLNDLRTRGIKVAVVAGQLKINAPQGLLTPALKRELVQRKPDILAFLEKANRETVTKEPIVSVPREGQLPLSFSQERLLFLEKLNPGQATYNIPIGLLIKGKLDRDALSASAQALVARHETLRTAFVEVNGQPAGELQEKATIVIEKLPHAADEETVVHEFVHRLFELHTAPLMRIGLISRAENEHLLLFSIHHLVADGWSMGILLKDFLTLYEAFEADSAASLPALPLQFADFAHWQRQQMTDENLAGSINFWSEYLAGAPTLLDLPTDFPRPQQAVAAGANVEFVLPIRLTQGVKALSRKNGTTLYMTLLAAFQTFLYRYSGQEDIVIGSPIANRDMTEIEPVVGFFTNTLAMRSQIEPTMSFESLLAQVRETTLNVMAHQQVPFDQVVEALNPERSQAYNPVYQVLFALQNTEFDMPPLPDRALELVWVNTDTAKMDLFLEMREGDGDTISARLEYNTALFKRETAVTMHTHFLTFLQAIVADPTTAVSRINLLTAAERTQLTQTWNKTATPPPTYPLIHKRFEAKVRQQPQAIALEKDDICLTYQELNDKANQLAHYLQEKGVGVNTLVAIYLSRSVDMIVAVLAILKAGGAYLPLDPIYPPERRAYMLKNAEAKFVLTHHALANKLNNSETDLIFLDKQEADLTHFSTENPASAVTTDDLLYVIYTSGSTGKPKGVALPHRAIANLINWQLKDTVLPEKARTVQFTSLSFDVSCQEIFTTLCSGGTLVLIDETLRKNMSQLAHFLDEKQIERLYLPFIALQQLAEIFDLEQIQPTALREIITAGEQLQVTNALIKFFSSQPETVLTNQYGPSESHVVTAYTLTGNPLHWPSLPPIGYPIDNTQIYLLDQHLEPVAAGTVGEVYIGGVNVAQGYINQPETTAVRFIPNRFTTDLQWQVGQNLLYKTGDLARYLADGAIQYLGRADSQVKLRGYRIELGEVEAVLTRHPAVKEAAAIIHEDGNGEKRLVAYLVTHNELSAAILSDYLRPQLPDYMLPAAYTFLEAMPLTPSGKIARRVLPEPEFKREESKAKFVAPQTAVERELALIWQDLLNVPEVSIYDNFFDLGGQSLLAVRLFSKIRQKFQINLPLSTLFDAPTIAACSLIIEEALAQLAAADNSVSAAGQDHTPAWSPLVMIEKGKQERPLFFCVHGGGGNVLNFRDLSQHLGQDQPFYGLQAVGIDGVHEPLATIEEMAAHYIEAILPVQSAGPFFLGGYSGGGLIAFEMAQQLNALGKEVELIVFFDTFHPGLDMKKRELNKHLSEFKTRGLSYLAERANRKLARNYGQLSEKIKLKYYESKKGTVPYELRNSQMIYNIWNASSQYEPKPYAGKVLLFCAQITAEIYEHAGSERGWGETVANLEVVQIPGNHDNLLLVPNVDIIVEKLRAVLAVGSTAQRRHHA